MGTGGLAMADAVLVDVSEGFLSRVDSALVLLRGGVQKGGGGNQGSLAERGGDSATTASPLLVLACSGALAAGTKQEVATGLTRENWGFPVVVYSTRFDEAEVFEVLGGLASLRLCGGRNLDPREMMRSLALEFGVRHLVTLGGGALFGELLRGGCVDDLGLTFQPRILGNKKGETLSGPVGRFLPASIKASLVELKQEGGKCFTKWSLNYAKVRKRVHGKS